MTEVITGIHQLKLPLTITEANNPPKYINAYLVRGDRGYLLVDTGWDTAESFNSLKSQLAEIGAGIKDIAQIVVTHIHPDHYGLAGKLKRLSRAKFFLHYLEQAFIESRYTNMDGLLKQMAWWLHVNGVPPEELTALQTASVDAARFVVQVSPDTPLHGGEVISTGVFNFQVLWTPGHSRGHICLYEPARKCLISGDLLLPTISPNTGLHPQSGDNPLGDFINSLNIIKQLDIDIVLPGHENPFTGAQKRIAELLQHHELRNTEILTAIKSGPKTAYQISREMTWLSDTAGAGWQILSPFDKRLAVLETIAHLELMRIDGKVSKLSGNSIIYYQQN